VGGIHASSDWLFRENEQVEDTFGVSDVGGSAWRIAGWRGRSDYFGTIRVDIAMKLMSDTTRKLLTGKAGHEGDLDTKMAITRIVALFMDDISHSVVDTVMSKKTDREHTTYCSERLVEVVERLMEAMNARR
jgi:hypothetical protein